MTLLAQSPVEVLDEVIQLFDQAISSREARARRRMAEDLTERAKTGESRQQLLDELLGIVTDPDVTNQDVGRMIRDGIGWPRLRAARTDARPRLPSDYGHVAMLEVLYSYPREFTPQVAAIDFDGSTAAQPLLEAVEVLRRLNATGVRKVPEGAPTSFVPGSRRSGQPPDDPGTLGANPTWTEFSVPWSTSPPTQPRRSRRWRPSCTRHWGSAAGAEAGSGPVRLNADGELVIPLLSAEDIPEAADQLRAELVERLPYTPILGIYSQPASLAMRMASGRLRPPALVMAYER